MGLSTAQSSGRSSKHSQPTYQDNPWNRDQSILTLGKNWLYFDKPWQKKIQNMSYFWHFDDQDSGTPHFSHLIFNLYLLVYFTFAFEDLQNRISWGSSFALSSGL